MAQTELQAKQPGQGTLKPKSLVSTFRFGFGSTKSFRPACSGPSLLPQPCHGYCGCHKRLTTHTYCRATCGVKAAHRLSTPRGLLLCGAVPCRLHACYFYLSFVACLLGARSMLTGKVAHGQTDQVDLGPDGL